MRNWDDRPGKERSATAIARRAFMSFFRIPDAQVFPLVPPSVQELGIATGFDLQMEDRANLGHAGLIQARNMLLGLAAQDPKLVGVRPASLDDTQQLHINIDQEKANTLGVATTDIDSTLSTAWGGSFVNNFIDHDRVKRVYMQGDAPYRMAPEDLNRWYVRSTTGTMAPFSSFATANWALGPATLTRYNGLPSIEIQGQGAPGISSGTALQEMDKLFKKLPQGIGYELTGLSFQEQQSGAQAPSLYALSILIIYLCLAALYESWAIPLSVMLVIPLGVIGALGGGQRARPLQRHLLPGRPARHHRPFRQERDPDRGVRGGCGAQGHDGARRGPGSGAAAPAAHPDDLDRLHRRRLPAGGGDGRGRRQPERYRHRRDRRHADGDDPGDLLRPGLLPDRQHEACNTTNKARRQRAPCPLPRPSSKFPAGKRPFVANT